MYSPTNSELARDAVAAILVRMRAFLKWQNISFSEKILSLFNESDRHCLRNH